jgi:3-deoxy-manno-octulosonate cytidylyltransferase (CMP-KDO synthetase)
MIQWVYESAVRAMGPDNVVIATPDTAILEYCAAHGMEAVITSESHTTGTARVSEVAKTRTADFFINVQGDEPLIEPATIAACAEAFLDPEVQLSSVYAEVPREEMEDPSCVSVVLDKDGYALYFSRYTVPFPRSPHPHVLKHVGIYGYRSEPLKAFVELEPPLIELAEGLEQLRFLYHGYRIKMMPGSTTGVAVDLPEHVGLVEEVLRARANCE